MSRPPRSKFSRLARLGSLTSRVSGSYFGQQVKGVFQNPENRERALKKLHLQNAERIVDTMGTLKGAAMKVGQSLAVAIDGVDLPPDVARILGKLHDSAEPIPFEDIRDTIEGELEAPLSELFADFDEVPLGAASLAQAHAARLKDGTQVVVKALYTGIEDSVDADLGALKTLLVTSKVLRRDPAEVAAIFDEIRARLHEELDYYQEAANLVFFHAAMADLPNLSIPNIHPELCTGRVLTMDRLVGQSADAFAESASAEARQRAGDVLVHTFYDMVYRLRTLHADPHGGNYLFESDGAVGLIDFGCVKRLDLYWVADYARMAIACVDGDQETMMAIAHKLGVLAKRDAAAEATLWEVARIVIEPLRHDHYQCGGAADNVTAQLAVKAPGILRHRALRSPPELVFLHRALGGVYTLLRKIGHSANYGALFRLHAVHAIGVAEGRIEDGSPVVNMDEGR
jgi:predicted unusual protein kinase regulating ubiquinone biosynthesis (AarF/ABC1/UbiB family)